MTAASEWDAPAERKRVRPGLPGSIEDVMHRTGTARLLVHLDDDRLSGLHVPLLERAIGVIYLPQTERQSHYFHTQVAGQFDVLIHIDKTRALEPLEPSAPWASAAEPPETYPTAL